MQLWVLEFAFSSYRKQSQSSKACNLKSPDKNKQQRVCRGNTSNYSNYDSVSSKSRRRNILGRDLKDREGTGTARCRRLPPAWPRAAPAPWARVRRGRRPAQQEHTPAPPRHSSFSARHGPGMLNLAVSPLLRQPAPAPAARQVERASFLCNVIMHLLLPRQ